MSRRWGVRRARKLKRRCIFMTGTINLSLSLSLSISPVERCERNKNVKRHRQKKNTWKPRELGCRHRGGGRYGLNGPALIDARPSVSETRRTCGDRCCFCPRYAGRSSHVVCHGASDTAGEMDRLLQHTESSDFRPLAIDDASFANINYTPPVL